MSDFTRSMDYMYDGDRRPQRKSSADNASRRRAERAMGPSARAGMNTEIPSAMGFVPPLQPPAAAMTMPSGANMNTMGMNTMGMNTMGMNTMGMNTMGMNTMGMNATGMNAMGMNATGMNAMGMMDGPNMGMNTMGMMRNNLPASMGGYPLGMSAQGPSVDRLVDQTFLQMSGEAKQITQKWRELQQEATDLQQKKVDLRRQWAEHRRNRLILEDEKRRFKEVSLAGFAPQMRQRRIRLNVGGKVFETTAATLTRDPGSMLDALCRDDSPLAQLEANQAKEAAKDVAGSKDDEATKDDEPTTEEKKDESTEQVQQDVGGGVVFIDRDSTLFGHVLNFLRDGVVPQDTQTLRNLYREAKYYELRSLANEIEKRLGIVALLEPRTNNAYTDAMGMKPSGASTLGLGDGNTRSGNQQWWERPSNYRGWWPSQRRGEADMSWWTGEQYGGRSTTSVLRAYDRTGVGTRPGGPGMNTIGRGYENYMRTGGIGSTLRDADIVNTTWDSMGRGPRPRPYDFTNTSLSASGTGAYGTYMGVRASGGATRFR